MRASREAGPRSNASRQAWNLGENGAQNEQTQKKLAFTEASTHALGAASVQLGPEIVALVVELHTYLGVPLVKVVHVLMGC